MKPSHNSVDRFGRILEKLKRILVIIYLIIYLIIKILRKLFDF